MKKFWVYMLLCENNHYYTGYTNDLQRRYQEHLNGSRKCKYTQAFKPVKIAQSWELESKSTAMKVECLIKKLSREVKHKLVVTPELLDSLVNA